MRTNRDGYVIVYAPNHFQSNKHGYCAEHRMVMADHLGRRLSSDELVHHINEIRSDNRIENLQLTNRAEHQKLHKRTTICKICGAPERCRGLCANHYSASVSKDKCKKCGASVWVDARSPKQLCRSCAMTGEGNGRAKLTERDVKAIRKERSKLGTSFPKIAKKYGVTKTMARLIFYRKCWKHVK